MVVRVDDAGGRWRGGGSRSGGVDGHWCRRGGWLGGRGVLVGCQ